MNGLSEALIADSPSKIKCNLSHNFFKFKEKLTENRNCQIIFVVGNIAYLYIEKKISFVAISK